MRSGHLSRRAARAAAVAGVTQSVMGSVPFQLEVNTG